MIFGISKWFVWGSLCFYGCIGQDLSLYGKISSFIVAIDSRELSSIQSTCYGGLLYATCVPVLPDDDFVLAEQLPYLLDLENLQGAPYCLQCCGSTPDMQDYWDLQCILDQTAPSLLNFFGYEARFARRAYPGDNEVVICPFRRNGCLYADNGTTLGINLFPPIPMTYFFYIFSILSFFKH